MQENPTQGYLEFIKAHANCCITGQPLAGSTKMYIISLPVPAPWAFPVWGDYSLGVNAKALAFIGDEAVSEHGIPNAPITQAIEIRDGEIIYHPVNVNYYNAATPAFT